LTRDIEIMVGAVSVWPGMYSLVIMPIILFQQFGIGYRLNPSFE
jgi:hypothetical protein